MAERGEARLPGVVDGDASIVFHVDMDCFYAACERRREPSLNGKPVVVGMGYEDGETHGAVATASYEARSHGIESAQPISTALERLPRAATATNPNDVVGHYRPVDLDYYQSVSEEVRDYSPRLRRRRSRGEHRRGRARRHRADLVAARGRPDARRGGTPVTSNSGSSGRSAWSRASGSPRT